MIIKSIVFAILLNFYVFADVNDALNEILHLHVDKSSVDYKGLKLIEPKIEVFIENLKKENIHKLTRNEKLAFYINAYNLCTLKLILDYYPVKSIKDIPVSKRWKHKRWNIGGTLFSLDGIEHEVLRKMNEPRIHFAINCASFSCPDLKNVAFDAKKLGGQLEQVTNQFLLNKEKGLRIEKTSSFFFGDKTIVYLSSIFSWFKEDFVKSHGSLRKWILANAPDSIKRELKKGDFSVKFMRYDWSLND